MHTQHTHLHRASHYTFIARLTRAPQALLELLAIIHIRITGTLVGYTWGHGLRLRPWGLVSYLDPGGWSRTQTLGAGLGLRPWGLVSDSETEQHMFAIAWICLTTAQYACTLYVTDNILLSHIPMLHWSLCR